METVMYLSNRGIQVVQGTYERQTLKISLCRDYPFDEGVIIDGTILNEDSVRQVLKQVKGLGISKSRLVLSSGKILKKVAILPKVKDREMRKLIIDELRDLNEGVQEVVYDYTILRNKIEGQSGIEVLCVGVETDLLESYITLFNSVNIELQSVDIGTNAISKLVKSMPELNELSFIITTIDGNDLTSYMFIRGNYVFSRKSRLLAESGTSAFISELSNNLSQLVQFKRANYKDDKIDNIYLSGDELENKEMTFETLGFNLDVNVEGILESANIVSTSTTKVDIYHYIYPISALIRRKGK